MLTRMQTTITAIGALLAVAGCGGGGGTGATAAQAPPAPGNPPVVSQGPLGQAALVRVVVNFPAGAGGPAAHDRRPSYVSHSTNGVGIISVAHGTALNGGTEAMTDVSSGSPACGGVTGTPRTCTALANAPIGNDDLRITLYDAVPAGPTTPAGNALATHDLTAGTAIAAGQTNTVPVTLDGIIGSLAFAVTHLSAPADGNSHALTLPVSAADADANTIIAPGNYTVPIGLSISGDTNGALALSTSSITSPPVGGTTNVTVTYNSSISLTSATVTASASGSSNSPTVTITPIIYSPLSLSLVLGNGTASVTIQEPGYSSAFTATSSATSVATVTASATPGSPGAAVTFTVTPKSAGNANVTISDSYGGAAVVPVTITSTNVVIPIP